MYETEEKKSGFFRYLVFGLVTLLIVIGVSGYLIQKNSKDGKPPAFITRIKSYFENMDRDKDIVRLENNLKKAKDKKAFAHKAMSYAIEQNDLKIIKYLIDRKWITRTELGNKPGLILKAAEMGHQEVFIYLIDQGADYRAKNKGNTILHYAIKSYNSTLVAHIVESMEFGLNAQNDKGKTALHTLIEVSDFQTRDYNLFTYLIEKGADMDLQDEKGDTCLHIAARKGTIDAVKFLLENDCQVDPINKKERTPFLTACDAKQKEIALLLYNYGAYIGQRDKHGKNFIDLYGSQSQAMLHLPKPYFKYMKDNLIEKFDSIKNNLNLITPSPDDGTDDRT